MDAATARRKSRKFSLAAASSAHWNRPRSLLQDDDPVPQPTMMELDPPPATPTKRRLSTFQNDAAITAVQQEEEAAAAAAAAAKKVETQKKMSDEAMEMERRRREEDLVVEHFGFAPVDFVDDVINAVNDLMYQAMEEFQRFVEGEMEDQVEVEKGMASLETLLENVIDKYFDKFELYALQNIFSLPRNVSVVLPQYRDIDPTATEALDRELDAQIEQMRRELIAEKFMNLKLKAALKVLNHDVPCLEKILKDLRSGVGELAEDGGAKMKTSLSQLTHHLADLRRLSDSAITRSTPSTQTCDTLVARSQDRLRPLTETIEAYLQRGRKDGKENDDGGEGVLPWRRGGGVGRVEVEEGKGVGGVPEELAAMPFSKELSLDRFEVQGALV
ncbi:hypothetical protein HDU67_006633 [Dinochytrium kinnereticum]|nr:hypothetical protein HDU67_006633 [Dinochytrium kinnereticum]